MRGWILILVCLLGSTPLAALAQDSGGSSDLALGLRADGYIGVATIDINGVFEDETFEGGGTGSVAAVLGSIYGQLDIFGDARDFDGADTSTVGFGARVGWRDPERGSAGLAGTYTALEIVNTDFDVGRIGVEGEIFLEVVTVGAEMGYVNVDSGGFDSDIFYFDTALDFYASDDFKLQAGVGVVDGKNEDAAAQLHAGMEYYLGGAPVSLFTRWEASLSDDVDQHSFIVGARIYWGADGPSLKTYDRSYFKDSCAGFQLIGRIC